ncbi:MAG: tRNA-binding protein [Candidatus Limnocylindrales bacterium]
MTDHGAGAPSSEPFQPPGSATWADFERLDLWVGRIVSAAPFPEARKPAYRLTIDFGPHGQRHSSAQLPPTYPDPTRLIGRLVVCVVNFAPKRIAGYASDVLVLGALPADGTIPLLDVDEGARPGDPVG